MDSILEINLNWNPYFKNPSPKANTLYGLLFNHLESA